MLATARYIISADDRTKAAINSALTGFRGLERGVRATVSRLNLALSIFAGAGLRQLNNQIVRAAEGNKEFAKAMQDVRAATQNLVSGGDLTRAITSLRELEATLKDPEVARAVQNWTSMWLSAWARIKAGAAETLVIVDKFSKGVTRGAPFVAPGSHGPGQGGIDARRAASLGRELDAVGARAGDRITRGFNVMQEFKELSKWLEDFTRDSENLDEQRKEAFLDLDEAVKKSYSENAELIYDQFSKEQQAQQDLYDWRREQEKEIQDEMTVYAEQAARNMQDAFAQFLFDPFEDGLKGMLRGFIDVIRRMLAEMAAAKIFGSKAGGGLGFADFVGALFSGIGSAGGGGKTGGARAMGGPVSRGVSYTVGERGPERFIPGVSGYIQPNGGQSVSVPISIYNDNRGATADFIKLLPEHDLRMAEQIETRIVTKLQRRQYDL